MGYQRPASAQSQGPTSARCKRQLHFGRGDESKPCRPFTGRWLLSNRNPKARLRPAASDNCILAVVMSPSLAGPLPADGLARGTTGPSEASHAADTALTTSATDTPQNAISAAPPVWPAAPPAPPRPATPPTPPLPPVPPTPPRTPSPPESPALMTFGTRSLDRVHSDESSLKSRPINGISRGDRRKSSLDDVRHS